MNRTPKLLYHYTCDDAYPLILSDDVLLPGPDGLVWLTDIAPPAPRLALGLTSYSLSCDRLAHVFEIEPTTYTQWWMEYRQRHRELWEKETSTGVMPMHWWVSEQPLPIHTVVAA